MSTSDLSSPSQCMLNGNSSQILQCAFNEDIPQLTSHIKRVFQDEIERRQMVELEVCITGSDLIKLVGAKMETELFKIYEYPDKEDFYVIPQETIKKMASHRKDVLIALLTYSKISANGVEARELIEKYEGAGENTSPEDMDELKDFKNVSKIKKIASKYNPKELVASLGKLHKIKKSYRDGDEEAFSEVCNDFYNASWKGSYFAKVDLFERYIKPWLIQYRVFHKYSKGLVPCLARMQMIDGRLHIDNFQDYQIERRAGTVLSKLCEMLNHIRNPGNSVEISRNCQHICNQIAGHLKNHDLGISYCNLVRRLLPEMEGVADRVCELAGYGKRGSYGDGDFLLMAALTARYLLCLSVNGVQAGVYERCVELSQDVYANCLQVEGDGGKVYIFEKSKFRNVQRDIRQRLSGFGQSDEDICRAVGDRVAGLQTKRDNLQSEFERLIREFSGKFGKALKFDLDIKSKGDVAKLVCDKLGLAPEAVTDAVQAWMRWEEKKKCEEELNEAVEMSHLAAWLGCKGIHYDCDDELLGVQVTFRKGCPVFTSILDPVFKAVASRETAPAVRTQV